MKLFQLIPVACLGLLLTPQSADAQSTRARGQEARQRVAELNAGLYQLEEQALGAANSAIQAQSAKVTVARPVQDKYGDPMYTYYGPMATAPGTPNYDGPRYGASFSRPYAQPMHDGNYRGYARGAYEKRGLINRSDVHLGSATNASYLQQGMQVAPGMAASSYQRAMINNP